MGWDWSSPVAATLFLFTAIRHLLRPCAHPALTEVLEQGPSQFGDEPRAGKLEPPAHTHW